MAYVNPDEDDFKEYFFRDFPYGTTLDKVTDADITNALADASFNFNPALFSSQEKYTLCYLLLSAHFLVTNLRNSSQGIAGQYSWLTTSKGVGSVNEASQIPQRILDTPEFAMLSKTNYGAKYLMMLLPLLTGQMFIACGRTQP